MPIADVSRPQFSKRSIDLETRNRAMLDIDQAVGVAPEKSDDTLLRMNGDAVAIPILFG